MSAELPEFNKSKVKTTFAQIALRSAGLILFLGIIALFVNVFFGQVAVERYNRDQLFEKFLNGRTEIRAMALGEWARQLQRAESESELELEALRPLETQANSLVVALENLKKDSPSQARYGASLISVLSFDIRRRESFEALVSFVRSCALNEFIDEQIAALIGLARSPLPPELDELYAERLKSPDPSLRKAVAYAWAAGQAAGPLRDNVLQALVTSLADSSEEVRWNAALALARRGHREARGYLLNILKEIAENPEVKKGLLSLERFEAYRETIRVALELEDEELQLHVKALAREHSSVKIREAALKALKQKNL